MVTKGDLVTKGMVTKRDKGAALLGEGMVTENMVTKGMVKAPYCWARAGNSDDSMDHDLTRDGNGASAPLPPESTPLPSSFISSSACHPSTLCSSAPRPAIVME